MTFFCGRPSYNSDGMLRSSGGLNFQLRNDERFISANLKNKACVDWRREWFYMIEHISTSAVY
jgi:hypothetical protein